MAALWRGRRRLLSTTEETRDEVEYDHLKEDGAEYLPPGATAASSSLVLATGLDCPTLRTATSVHFFHQQKFRATRIFSIFLFEFTTRVFPCNRDNYIIILIVQNSRI